jgi:hypothetical protein
LERIRWLTAITLKGLGRFYGLTLQTDGDLPDCVLLERNVLGAHAVRSLVGRRISAQVYLSPHVNALEVQGVSALDEGAIRIFAEGGTARYEPLALLFAISGFALGLATLEIGRKRVRYGAR